MPPLEDTTQPISGMDGNDCSMLANRDLFEITKCPNYDHEVKDFVHKIMSNNNCGVAFCHFIKFINPLSHCHRSKLAKYLVHKEDVIPQRGWNAIKSSQNVDEITIVVYVIEYAHSARESAENGNHSDSKKRDKGNSRKKIFDRLNNIVRHKLKQNALSLDVLSLIVSCHFVSSLSPKTGGFFRSLLKEHLPSYLQRCPMNGSHFMRLFDSVLYHREHFHKKELMELFFQNTNEHIDFSDDHIRSSSGSGVHYDHLFTVEVVHYVLKQIIDLQAKCSGNKLPESAERFTVNLLKYTMTRYVLHSGTQSVPISGELLCLLLSVHYRFRGRLKAHIVSAYEDALYNRCVAALNDKKLNIILLSRILSELERLSLFNKFLRVMANNKAQFVVDIIKKAVIVMKEEIITKRHGFNAETLFKDEQFLKMKGSYVSIAVLIAQKHEDKETTNAVRATLTPIAKNFFPIDEKTKKLSIKMTTIFNKAEFQKLIWCFGFAEFRNPKFWRHLFELKVAQFTEKEINAPILTKFAWAMARNKEYLSKYKEEKLVHRTMAWCVRNGVELLDRKSSADLKMAQLFSLQQLSTICGAMSIVGKPGTECDMNEYAECDRRAYLRWFDAMVSDPWDIVDSKLAAKAQCYLNLLAAILTFKSELLADDDKIEGNDTRKMKRRYERKTLLVDVDDDGDSDSADPNGANRARRETLETKTKKFVLHVLTQFGATERGKEYMKEDYNVVDFLLHIVAEWWNDMGPEKWTTMTIQMNGMLQCLPVDRISADAAFSIACTLSRIPMHPDLNDNSTSSSSLSTTTTTSSSMMTAADSLRQNRQKVVNSLAAVVVQASRRKRKGAHLALDHVLGLCSSICVHSAVIHDDGPNGGGKMKVSRGDGIWDENMLSALLQSAKHFWALEKWTESHFLLKNHLKFFIDSFEAKEKKADSLLQ